MRSLKDAFDSLSTLRQDYKASIHRTAILSTNCYDDYSNSDSSTSSNSSGMHEEKVESSSPDEDYFNADILFGSSQRSFGFKIDPFTPLKKNAPTLSPQDLDTIIRMKREKARQQISKLQRGDLYRILEIDASVSETEITKAYRRLSLRCHPDKPGGDAQKFHQINQAYKILLNPEMRALYDQHGQDYIDSYLSSRY